jgi:hypothetical protein
MGLFASKADAKRRIQTLIDTNDSAVYRGILAIFSFQTATEQAFDGTVEDNGVGFSGVDAELLSSFAKQIQKKGSLSEKQMVYARKKIRKYWNQLRVIAEEKAAAKC